MLNILTGTNATLSVAFMFQGDYEIPDANSVTYTLRDNLGNAVPGYVDLPLTPAAGATSVSIVIPGSENTNAKTFELRTVVVSYTVNGAGRAIPFTYRVINFVQMTATPDDVRRLLSVAANELPDSDIDLIEAYFLVANEVTPSVLTTALSAGDITTIAANKALAARAALEVIPTLQLRILQVEQSATDVAKRYSGVDFQAVRDYVASVYAQNKATFTGITTVTYEMAVMVTPLDAVTGA